MADDVNGRRDTMVACLRSRCLGAALAALAALAVVVPPLRAQIAAGDSTGIAAAIAQALRRHIPDSGIHRGAQMDPRPDSHFAAPPWTRLVGDALRTIDSTLLPVVPDAYTTRISVVSVSLSGDSLAARVAISQCRDTPRGLMMGGTAYNYAFRRSGNAWQLVTDRTSGHGDGLCTGTPVQASHRVSDSLTVFADVYRARGPTDRPVVLLFHQGGGDARGEYADVIPRLLDAGYHVVSTDVRGGGTRFGPGHRAVAGTGFRYCDAYADVAAGRAMARARGLTGPLFIWGSSYTATLALQHAAHAPSDVRGVLAFSPARGEPMAECEPMQYFARLRAAGIPVLLVNSSAELDASGRRAVFDSLGATGVRTLLAEGTGHGSSVLVASRFAGDVEPLWVRVLAFLREPR